MPIIETEQLAKSYETGSGTVVAVEDISLSIPEGTVVGLLGPNGAGKTTTIKMLLGLVRPSSGEARVHGVNVSRSPNEIYDRASAMLEGARNIYWRLTVRENLRFFARIGNQPADSDRIEELIAQVGLEAKADEPVNKLSRGMKQKASIACTLVRETSIVFLDEPTLGLDVESSIELRQTLRNLVKQEGRTVVISTHDMNVIEEICDRVVIMDEGKIIADDTVENLLDVFNRRIFRLTLEEPLSNSVRIELEDRFDARYRTHQNGQFRFDVPDIGEDGFYAMMDVLRTSPATLVAVETLSPDLEEVFLRIVDQGEVVPHE